MRSYRKASSIDETIDVAVIGGGLAALSAALAAVEHGARTAMFVNGPIGRANSVMAQGGMQVPANHVDAGEMVADIERHSGEDVDQARVASMVGESSALVSRLEAIGVEFDRNEAGSLVRRTAGGISTPRIVTAGDAIGRPLIRALRQAVAERISYVEAEIEGLLPTDSGWTLLGRGVQLGAASAVVVATSGTSFHHARLHGYLTTNPPNRNERIRQSLRDLGLVEERPQRFQWHPFGLPTSARGITVQCVPESVAAIGGVQLKTDDGELVCALPAPRSAVVAAMRCAERNGARTMRLDLSRLTADQLSDYPKLARTIKRRGPQLIVSPAVHYELTGFLTEADCSTVRPGLFLAGEIAGGIHGRERLMGIGIVDSLVHGHRSGIAAASAAQG